MVSLPRSALGFPSSPELEEFEGNSLAREDPTDSQLRESQISRPWEEIHLFNSAWEVKIKALVSWSVKLMGKSDKEPWTWWMWDPLLGAGLGRTMGPGMLVWNPQIREGVLGTVSILPVEGGRSKAGSSLTETW